MKKIPLIVFIFPLLVISACTKTRGLTGADGPAAQLLKGNVGGYVDLFDEEGNLQNLDGVTVTVEEDTSHKATTNTYGYFELDSLKTGTYTLDFKKSGYGDNKVISMQLTGGSNIYLPSHVEMSRIPDFYLTSASVSSAMNYLTVTGNYNSTSQSPRNAIAFIGTNSNVSSKPGNYYYVVTPTTPQIPGSTYTLNISYQVLHSSGFLRGSTVYIALYGSANIINSSSYMDPSTGSTVYNAISTQTSATTSATVDK